MQRYFVKMQTHIRTFSDCGLLLPCPLNYDEQTRLIICSVPNNWISYLDLICITNNDKLLKSLCTNQLMLPSIVDGMDEKPLKA